jgi:hypothetical protein
MANDPHQKLIGALTRDADRYRKAVEELEVARARLTERVRAAHVSGIRQVDILRATGHLWTREHLRQLTKDQPDGQ